MEHIYVCRFSNDRIKVGRSVDPKARIAVHANRVACVGVDLVDSRIFEVAVDSWRAERDLIQACSSQATEIRGNEWFAGLAFDEVCKWAANFAGHAYGALPEDEEQIFILSPLTARDSRYSYVDGAWVDSRPDEPHWPTSDVMRWDARPEDWHLLWPELITHPCAILFAINHPNRDGGPQVKDWVLSWPKGYDIKNKWPSAYQMVMRCEPGLLERFK